MEDVFPAFKMMEEGHSVLLAQAVSQITLILINQQDHMDKPLLFSIAVMNLTLSGSFLIPTETHLCVKLQAQRA